MVLRTSALAEEDPSTFLPAFHENCTRLVYDGTDQPVEEFRRASRRWQVLATCRLIYREMFPIFWRRMRFCFQKNSALSIFLKKLNAAQKDNLRHLVIIHNPSQIERITWSVCNETSGLLALKSLVHLELHLQLPTRGWADPDPLKRRAPIVKEFKFFENLRLLQLEKAPVIVSYCGEPQEAGRYLPGFCSNDELRLLARSFTQRLLNKDQSLRDYLEERLSEVGKSLRAMGVDPVKGKEEKLKALSMFEALEMLEAFKMFKAFRMLVDQNGLMVEACDRG